MKFLETDIDGAWVIDIEAHRDDRGFFARTFCNLEFAAHGLETEFAQHSTSHSERAGTVRGMHYQAPPHEEVKIVRCLAGAIHDVLIDIRPQSPTYRHLQAFELDAGGHRQLYIPKGVAHGFQTLADHAVVGYMISAPQAPDAARGVRHDDPAFIIAWPLPISVISDRDRNWPFWPG